MREIRKSGSVGGAAGQPPPRPGRILAVWMLLIVALNGAAWLVGVRGYTLNRAVDQGAARPSWMPAK